VHPVRQQSQREGRRGDEDQDTCDERRSNEWAQAVFDLAEILDGIDSVASEYWGIFLRDVRQGIYASDGSWLDPPDG
jgi:hypothetical protein